MPGQGKQFQAGNPGGPGRPRKPRISKEYLEDFTAVCTREVWRLVIGAGVSLAQDPTAAGQSAREWLSKYIVGGDPVGMIEFAEELDEIKQQIADGNTRAVLDGSQTTPASNSAAREPDNSSDPSRSNGHHEAIGAGDNSLATTGASIDGL